MIKNNDSKTAVKFIYLVLFINYLVIKAKGTKATYVAVKPVKYSCNVISIYTVSQ